MQSAFVFSSATESERSLLHVCWQAFCSGVRGSVVVVSPAAKAANGTAVTSISSVSSTARIWFTRFMFQSSFLILCVYRTVHFIIALSREKINSEIVNTVSRFIEETVKWLQPGQKNRQGLPCLSGTDQSSAFCTASSSHAVSSPLAISPCLTPVMASNPSAKNAAQNRNMKL